MRRILITSIIMLASALAAKAEGERFEEFRRVLRDNAIEKNDSAALFLELWAKDEPDNAEQIYCHGIFHYLQARPQIEYTEDLKEFEKTAMLPACNRFGKLQINCYWIMKDHGNGMEHYVKAHEYFKKAIEVRPNILELYLHLSEFYMWKYETKYATALALDLLALHQADSTRWTDFYEAPVKDANSIIEQHMNELLGELIQKQEFSLGAILCDTLLSRYPDNMIYRFDKGVYLINTFKQKEAISHFEQMNKDYPNDGNIINALATLYSQTGDTKKARKYATMLSQSENTQWALTGRQLLSSMEDFTVDFEAIQTWMNDNAEEYKALEQRFISGDASLTNLELSRIYFGHALTEQCKSTKLTDIDLKALCTAKEYTKCLEECRKILEQHPASIAALMYGVMSASNLENEADCVENLYLRFNQIVAMINKDAEDSMKSKKSDFMHGTKYYKILWRTDENVFVELMPEEERTKTSFFANPGYFYDKE